MIPEKLHVKRAVEMTENELLLLMDIAKDQYEENIEHYREITKGYEVDTDYEIAFIIKSKLLPDIAEYQKKSDDYTLTSIVDPKEYDDMDGETIKEIRKNFKKLFKEKDTKKSNYRKKVIWRQFT